MRITSDLDGTGVLCVLVSSFIRYVLGITIILLYSVFCFYYNRSMKTKVDGKDERRFNNVYNWILHYLRFIVIMFKIELNFIGLRKK